MDNFVIAVSRYRRRKYQEAIELCDLMLSQNQKDESVWVLKCKSLTRKFYLDDIEIDEEGIGDLIMDDNAVNSLARPGTSLQRQTGYNGQGARPMSIQGRPITGFARPVTQRQANQEHQLKSARVSTMLGTARPMTQGGRYMRLGTASLQQMGDKFISVDKLDYARLASKPVISRSLCDYLIYVEHNPYAAQKLAAEAILQKNEDWWWRERLGKAYFLMRQYRQAEDQFKSSRQSQYMVKTELQLIKVYLRLDQPSIAIELFKENIQKHPYEISFLVGLARIYDSLNQPEKCIEYYKNSLIKENSNLEAVASLGSYYFYMDQPEVALQFYKRLIQLGIYKPEIWNNLGLCCFYSGQYDLYYPCFERALCEADDKCRADIWYNLSHIFINLGDTGTAIQCLKLSVCLNQNHAEAYNNLGVLLGKGINSDLELATMNLSKAIESNEHLYEPLYNKAALLFNQHEFASCYELVKRALTLYPEHNDSVELKQQVERVLQQI